MKNEPPPLNRSEDAIVVKDLWKSFNSLEVLKGLNLTVKQGETVVILGRSGVGKSVLLKQILGIETPDKGEVWVHGKNITQMDQQQKFQTVRSMGMLFQGAALFDSMTVGQNTAFYLNQHDASLSSSEVSDRVAKALDMVGLKDTENKMPSDLSGGMKKRAALARLIVYRPQILLYDEPTTGLDPITAMQINEMINKTQQELQATSIVVTHDLKSALEVGDRLAFHENGQIKQIAPKAEFLQLQDPTLQSFFKNAMLTPKDFGIEQIK